MRQNRQYKKAAVSCEHSSLPYGSLVRSYRFVVSIINCSERGVNSTHRLL